MNDIIRCARTYIGTPVIHQGRLKGVGIDCVGLIVCVGRELGINITEPPPEYGRIIRDHRIATLMNEQFIGPKKTWNPGDILVLGWRKFENHLGIATDEGVIHASRKFVVEHILGEPYTSKIMSVYEWPLF